MKEFYLEVEGHRRGTPRACCSWNCFPAIPSGCRSAEPIHGAANRVAEIFNIKITEAGQWLWLSWQSLRFQHQRSKIRIESSTNFIWNICLPFVNCIEKMNNKEIEAHLKFELMSYCVNIQKCFA